MLRPQSSISCHPGGRSWDYRVKMSENSGIMLQPSFELEGTQRDSRKTARTRRLMEAEGTAGGRMHLGRSNGPRRYQPSSVELTVTSDLSLKGR